ncbi:MAG: hypothetical protein NZ699_01455 [Roseiflexus sp.]|nr:hypothetical protein [Roseiflexus sp.]MCS7287777.1 hypothetical protein [Roseiflexus sp.]MDW8147593.1 hypothetical protein [Roseiflexaceae bacterium]MDW8234538.1 hypothetical protein [Roseiflexaceae bacterium]
MDSDGTGLLPLDSRGSLWQIVGPWLCVRGGIVVKDSTKNIPESPVLWYTLFDIAAIT